MMQLRNGVLYAVWAFQLLLAAAAPGEPPRLIAHRAWAQSLGVPVVPSVNIFHYAGLDDHFKAAESDIRRLRELSVKEFQIDSVFDRWLREK